MLSYWEQTVDTQVTSKQEQHNGGIWDQTVCMQYGSKSKKRDGHAVIC